MILIQKYRKNQILKIWKGLKDIDKDKQIDILYITYIYNIMIFQLYLYNICKLEYFP